MKIKLHLSLIVAILLWGCGSHKHAQTSFGGRFAPATEIAAQPKMDSSIKIPTETYAGNGFVETNADIVETQKVPFGKSILKQYQAYKKLTFKEKIAETAKAVKHLKSAPNKTQSSGGGGGVALIAVLLLLFLLFRKVLGLSAGWSWGLVIFLLAVILILMWAAYGV